MKILKPLIYLAVFVFLCLVGFSTGAFLWFRDMSSPPERTYDRKVFIEQGANTRTIANTLKQAEIIRSAFLFRLYIRFLAVDQRLRPGSYFFKAGESLNQVVFKLLQGTMKTVAVTIPEGTTNRQVAEILQNAGICDAKEFLEASSDPQIIVKVFNDWELIPAPEGLLFPDTYNFNRPTPAEKVAERMYRLARHQIDRIFSKGLPDGLSPYEACILASIVEKEAVKKEERPIIASVFINRLKKRIRLESCATVLYAHGEHKNRVLFEDLKIDSPYNTYKYAGLPPTPISNFGTSSMMAVANPAKTDYLYFVSDGQRGHKFSRSLKDHNRYREEFFRQRKRNSNQ
ncbi:MAG: endolytic transglycosylase MltG [Candidatus Rifleibacteriota bacterium]